MRLEISICTFIGYILLYLNFSIFVWTRKIANYASIG